MGLKQNLKRDMLFTITAEFKTLVSFKRNSHTNEILFKHRIQCQS